MQPDLACKNSLSRELIGDDDDIPPATRAASEKTNFVTCKAFAGVYCKFFCNESRHATAKSMTMLQTKRQLEHIRVHQTSEVMANNFFSCTLLVNTSIFDITRIPFCHPVLPFVHPTRWEARKTLEVPRKMDEPVEFRHHLFFPPCSFAFS